MSQRTKTLVLHTARRKWLSAVSYNFPGHYPLLDNMETISPPTMN